MVTSFGFVCCRTSRAEKSYQRMNLGDQGASILKNHNLAKNLKFYRCIFQNSPDKEFIMVSSVVSCFVDR